MPRCHYKLHMCPMEFGPRCLTHPQVSPPPSHKPAQVSLPFQRFPPFHQFSTSCTGVTPSKSQACTGVLPMHKCLAYAQVSHPLLTSLNRCPTHAQVSHPSIGVTTPLAMLIGLHRCPINA